MSSPPHILREGLRFPIFNGLILVLLLSRLVDSDPHFVGVRCVDTAGTYTQPSAYRTNLNSLLNLITVSSEANSSTQSTSALYSSDVVQGESPDTTVYGFWYCRGDLPSNDCRSCVASAIDKIVAGCPVDKEAIIWYQECMLRYANRVVFPLEEDDPWIWQRSESTVLTTFNMNADQFGQYLSNTLHGLIMEAAYNYTSVKFYGSQTDPLTTTQNLNSLAQCSPGLDSSQMCETCLLRMIQSGMTSCCGWGSVWAMLFSPSCFVMYTVASNASSTINQSPSTSTSTSTSSQSISGGSGTGTRFTTVAIAAAAGFCAIGIFLAIWCCLYGRNRDSADAAVPICYEVEEARSPIDYTLELLRRALEQQQRVDRERSNYYNGAG